MKKNLTKIIALFAVLSVAMAFTACTENTTTGDTGPQTQTATAYDTLDSVFDVTDKTPADVEYLYDEDNTLYETVPGYDLGDFLTLTAVNGLVDPAEAETDYRTMFCYDVAASDGYTYMDENKLLLDLDTMLTGKYLYDTKDDSGQITVAGVLKDCRVHFPSTDIAKGYDTKKPQDIDLYRAIKISTTVTGVESSNVLTDSFVSSSLNWVKIETDSSETANTNDAIAAENFVYDFFVANSGDKTTATYLVKCADYDEDDDHTFEELTYTQLQSAYFFPANETLAADGAYEDLIVVMNKTAADGTTPANSSGSLRLKMPVEIEISLD